jgi:hypothetical protein
LRRGEGAAPQSLAENAARFFGLYLTLENDSLFRHGRASSRPSTSFLLDAAKTFMPGTRPGMTSFS